MTSVTATELSHRSLAIVPAAGSGTRLGLGPKAFVQLDGSTLLERCVAGLRAAHIDLIVVVVSREMLPRARDLFGCDGPADPTEPSDPFQTSSPALEAPASGRAAGQQVRIAVGGAERSDSVRAGFAAAGPLDVFDVVLVHDAARCLTPANLIGEVIAAVRAGARAVIPVVPVADTIKHVDDDGIVDGTPDRARLRAVQTPQGFAPDTLSAAYAASGASATDDAGLVERLGVPVQTIAGDPRALKITTRFDLELARLLLQRETPSADTGATAAQSETRKDPS